jgi:hypothetical protein
VARIVCGASCALLILASSALALEAVGTLKKIDADKSIVVVFAGGQDRTLKVDKDLKVVDEKGKDLPDGLKSNELKEGGLQPRQSDGLVWKREDLGGDGTHPSESGRRKVAELLLKFCKTDANVKSWFARQ